MTLSSLQNARLRPRPQRINLWGVVAASLRLENGRQLSGKLQTLSLTGGLLDLALYLDERTEVSLLFNFGEGVIQARARMLFPMRGGMGYYQPFQFTSIGPRERQIINAEITERLRQNVSPEKKVFGLGGARTPSSYLDTV